MTITRVGTSQQYADGWDVAFAGKRGGSAAAKSKSKSTAKKAAQSKKATPKKSAKKGKR